MRRPYIVMVRTHLLLIWFLFCLVIPPVSAQDPRPRNIRLEILIEKTGSAQTPYGSQTSREKTRQFVMALEGHEATIFVGKRVPYLVPIRQYLVENEYLATSIEFHSIGTRLRALPRIRGNMIQVEITPEISYQTPFDERTGVVRVEKLSTTVIVPNGGTIQLGAVETASEFYDHFYRNERGERLLIYLTPTIQE